MTTKAQLVYDGTFHLPEECGTPRDDQLQGTDLEKLCELAGRECYDSLGKGRSSADYHKHILEVGHLSVYEHANFTVEVRDDIRDIMPEVGTRPGIHVRRSHRNRDRCLISVNLRALIEWHQWDIDPEERQGAHALGESLHIVTSNYLEHNIIPEGTMFRHATNGSGIPLNDEEKWVSLRLVGSRGFSHEQVRHKFRTAVSQRSTRYVDESQSDWCWHPLIEQLDGDPLLSGVIESDCSDAYGHAVGYLEARLIDQGVDKGTARKQARGAARGMLGNALQTSMIFSASVAQWRRMIAMRATVHADAEIRLIYVDAIKVLKACAYGDRFADITLVASPDGIGEVVA